MTLQSVGFIGGGRVARILLGGWRRASTLPSEVIVYDPDTKALDFLRLSVGPAIATTGDCARVASADLVILAVHPPVFEEALAALRPELRPEAVVLSLAPKVVMTRMVEALGGFSRLARMIPNAPSIVGAGYNPIAFSEALGKIERREILALFQPLGECPQVEEEALEAYAIISGMGPTYLSFQLAALRDLGVDTERMATGAAATLFDRDLNEAEVLDLIPVRPLAAHEDGIAAAYRSELPALYAKLAGRQLAV